MNKPITVARQEYMEGLVKLCNEAQLPAFVKVDILQRLLTIVQKQMNEEYERDNAAYQKAKQEDGKTENSEPVNAPESEEQLKPFTGTVIMNGR